jgi:hypothetical protein
MKLLHYSIAALAAAATGTCVAFAQTDLAPVDTPSTTDGIQTVCTGGAYEARQDPRWRDYPFRLEFVGKDGQYLGDEVVNISGNGRSVVIHCQGPWVLMNLPRGAYHVDIDVADAGHKAMTLRSPVHAIIRFPDAGGVASIEHNQSLASR